MTSWARRTQYLDVGGATTLRWASLVAIVLVAGRAVQALTLSASSRSTPKKRPAVSFQVGRR
jgi:hypothetical protein